MPQHKTQLQDADLNELFAAGEARFEDLFHKLLLTARSTFYNREGFHDEDFAEDTASFIFMNRGKFKGANNSSFSTWVFRVISNRHLDWLRKRRSQRRRDEVSLDEAQNLPSEPLDDGREAIWSNLTRLDEESRHLLTLYLQNLTPEEIQEELGFSRSDYYRKLKEAINSMKAIQENEDK